MATLEMLYLTIDEMLLLFCCDAMCFEIFFYTSWTYRRSSI